MSHPETVTPPGTTRIPGENDWVKARSKTLLGIAAILIGATAWVTKTTFDLAEMRKNLVQVKADLAELKAYVLPPPIQTTRTTLQPHFGNPQP